MKRTVYVLALLFIGLTTQAQNWQFLRHEFGISIGASNFLGELGGADQVGTDFLKDLEFSMTRPAVQLDYRYTFNPNFHAKVYVGWAILSGDDALTEEPFRNNRNLNFKSNVWEVGFHFQYFPFQEKLGHLYRMKGAKGKGYSYLSPYVFAGFGGFKFNPKGKDANGGWHELQPLNTEGQGLPGGADNYSLFQIQIPYGIGIKYALTKQWNIGFELVRVMTFTDYVDDVSTEYYDNSAILAAYGTEAAYFADPSDPTFVNGNGWPVTQPGMQRGDATDNDAYMYALVSLNFKLLYGKFNLPKF